MAIQRTFVIAEAGVNHNGSLTLARELIDAAAEAGADAVKFQTFRADALVVPSAPKAAYQRFGTRSTESQRDMLRRLEFGPEEHEALIAHCRVRGIQFLSTPFDIESLELLVQRFGMPRLKIPSGEITNGPFLLAAAQTGLPVILSTGMSTLGEVEEALGVIAFGYTARGATPGLTAFAAAHASDEGQVALHERVTLLHCTSEYPTPPQDVHLRAMDTLRSAFGLPVGYSDHTQGIAVPIAAVARGAAVLEKHVTLDRTLPGPDHRASLEPPELKEMIRGVREVEAALGRAVKVPTAGELETREVARKSLVATVAIRRGEPLIPEMLAARRPGTGLSPMRFWERLGRPADRALEPDEPLT